MTTNPTASPTTSPTDRLADTTWIEPSAALAEQLSLPLVPLPVRAGTAASLSADRVEPAAIALDVDLWLTAGAGTPVQRAVLARWVGALAYVAGLELLDVGRPSTAARILAVGVRRVDDDPSLRALLGLARWDCGHRSDALAHLALAVDQYARAGQVAPLLTILTARALSGAGRHRAARDLLEPLVASDPRVPLFWDLVDTLDARVAAA